MHRALPGKYRILLGRRNNETEPVTVRVDFFLNWQGGSNGKAEPKHESVTLLFDGRDHQLPDLEFGWDENGESDEDAKSAEDRKEE